MPRSLSIVFALPLLAAVACDAAVTEPETSPPDGKYDAVGSSAQDCVIDTISFEDAVEFADGLAAAIDPQFVHSFPNAYDQVRVPSALSTPLFRSDEFGGYVYTLHGWDIVPGALVTELDGDADALFATVSGTDLGIPDRHFDLQRVQVARALFESLIGADEQVTEHIVPPEHVFDRSWIRRRRATAGNRLVCDELVHPDEPDGAPTYSCVISKVRWKTVQAFNTDSAGGFCPTP